MRAKFLILSFFLCLATYAQDKGYKLGFWGAYDQHPVIEANKQTTDGSKYVMSSRFIPTGKNSSIDEKSKFVIQLGMSISQYSDSVYYDLNVFVETTSEHYVSVLKGSPLLLKLSDGEIIKLYCKDDAEDKIGYVVSAHYNIISYSTTACYRISSKDVLKFKKGITKVRLEINAEKYDMEFRKYKNDELGQFLLSAYSLVAQTMHNQTDFEEGF